MCLNNNLKTSDNVEDQHIDFSLHEMGLDWILGTI